MHRIPEHRQRCNDCHDTHGITASGTRQECAACHEGMEDHIPEAQVCTGCHAFRSAEGPQVNR
jgi:hypothetical protein